MTGNITLISNIKDAILEALKTEGDGDDSGDDYRTEMNARNL